MASHPIRIGIGGWSYEPWNETFYPAGLAAKKQLAYASGKLTAIEINSTFYRNQTPKTFQKWSAESPEGFMFTVKAQRFTTSRKTPEEMMQSIDWFLDSGVTDLGPKLGPINWQFAPSKKFEPDYFAAFFAALPKEKNKVKLRHAIEVRHKSFAAPAFHDLLRKHGHVMISADDEDWPTPDIETADFAYARLQRSQPDVKTGYPAKAIESWAKTFKGWAAKRDVFAFFISGAKENNPAAAQALIARL